MVFLESYIIMLRRKHMVRVWLASPLDHLSGDESLDWSRRVTLDHTVRFPGGADLPVYLRVTQADGHQAWSSPIYLIA